MASHHGRESGFSQAAIELIRPEAVIVSAAKLPAEHDGISDYKKQYRHVFSTRIDGDAHIRMEDAGTLTIADEDGKMLVVFSDP